MRLLYDRTEVNFIQAAAAGATNAVALVANIIANLIAFIALLHFVNATLTWFGQRVGIERLTFQVISAVARIFRLDALALSVIATGTWLAGWLAVTLRYCIKTAKPIRKLFPPSESPITLVS